MVSYSNPPLAALGVAAAVADGDGNYRGHPMLGDEIVQSCEQDSVGAVRPDNEGRGRAGHVLFWHVHRDAASVGSGMAGGHHEFGRIGRIKRPKRIFAPVQSRDKTCCPRNSS